MDDIKLTDAERRAVMQWRRAEEARRREEERGLADRTLRDEHGVKVVRVHGGKHAPYAVYDHGDLVCYCVYRKGAFNLMDYILRWRWGIRAPERPAAGAKGAA